MRLLLLNRAFVPDVASSGQHLADLAVELVKRGHEVTVITSRRAYTHRYQRFSGTETWHGVRIVRVGSLGFGQGTVWLRLLDGLSFGILAFMRACFLPRAEVIVALTSPPMISVLGLCLARLRHCRFVYWVMDLNPDEAFAAGLLRAKSFVGMLLEYLSKMSLRGADRVIVMDRFMLRRIANKGICSSKVSVIPPWSHDSEVNFDVKGRHRFRRQHGLEGKFVVMYSGNHSLCHPLDVLLEAAWIGREETDIVFCFIGGGAQFSRIERAAQRNNVAQGQGGAGPRILCLPYQPFNQLSASLSAADLHVVVMGEAFVGIVHPCKIYNILRLPTPIIYVGPNPSPASEILDQEEPSRSACVSHSDPQRLANEIRRLLKESETARAKGWKIASRFSKETVLPRLLAELER